MVLQGGWELGLQGFAWVSRAGLGSGQAGFRMLGRGWGQSSASTGETHPDKLGPQQGEGQVGAEVRVLLGLRVRFLG